MHAIEVVINFLNFRMATRQILISLHLASTIIMIMASLCPENPSAIVTYSNNNGKSQLPIDLCNKLKCDMKKRKCCCCKNNQIVCNSVDMALDSVSKKGIGMEILTTP